MLDTPAGTGVTSYAKMLIEAARMGGQDVRILAASPSVSALFGPLKRWMSASRGIAMLQENGAGDLVGRDIFRLAHVRFNRSGRVLELEAPGPPGIMHWTYPVPMAMREWINIYTVHDAIPLSRPELTPIDSRRHGRLLETLRPFANRIVTVSEAARQDVLRSTGWSSDFVTDLSLAVRVGERADALLPGGLNPGGYLLFCGQIEPRKNLSRLIAAYTGSGLAMPLVLVGPDGWRAGPIIEQAATVPGVVRFPYLDRLPLLDLIAKARALVLPSLSEGFGLPVAEAMALGTPVLISRDPALVEVAGGAALAVDGEDVVALRRALIQVATDDMLCADLAARGLARAPAFGLDRFAARLAPFYASLVAERT